LLRTEVGLEEQALLQYRQQLDQLNLQLLRLLEERGRLAEQVLKLKRERRLPSHDPERERAMLANICAQARGPYAPEQLRRIFEGIFAVSREL
jgi:3-deoxy-7-phosphoheptulonate synthase/chorismate mutase